MATLVYNIAAKNVNKNKPRKQREGDNATAGNAQITNTAMTAPGVKHFPGKCNSPQVVTTNRPRQTEAADIAATRTLGDDRVHVSDGDVWVNEPIGWMAKSLTTETPIKGNAKREDGGAVVPVDHVNVHRIKIGHGHFFLNQWTTVITNATSRTALLHLHKKQVAPPQAAQDGPTRATEGRKPGWACSSTTPRSTHFLAVLKTRVKNTKRVGAAKFCRFTFAKVVPLSVWVKRC